MPETTFLISLGETELTVEEVWPDGDAPENPTAEDVATAMRSSRGPVLSDWNLLPDEVEIFETRGRTRARVRV